MEESISRRAFLQGSSVAATVGVFPQILSGSETRSGHRLSSVRDLSPDTMLKLGECLAGPVLYPTDEGYEEACRLWTGGIPKRPGLVVCCAHSGDVTATVNFARDHGLPLAVRGGGHTLHATCEGGVLINLMNMSSISGQPVWSSSAIDRPG